jgi:hypothetical protein
MVTSRRLIVLGLSGTGLGGSSGFWPNLLRSGNLLRNGLSSAVCTGSNR